MTEIIHRSTPVEVTVKAGRTVEAYAAVFGTPAEIRDGQGHYTETIDRSAFNKAIRDAAPTAGRSRWKTQVFYNHGMTLHGTPSETFSQPIARTTHLEADSTGLLTVSEYAETPLGEQMLSLIKDGIIVGQSFTGRIIRSNPDRRRYMPGSDGTLPAVTRTELGLSEYGPTPMPAYDTAEIVGVRSALLTAALSDPRALRALLAATQDDADLLPDNGDDDGGTSGPVDGPGTGSDGPAVGGTPPPDGEHVTRSISEWQREFRARLRTRGIA